MRLSLRSIEERVRTLGGRPSYDREFVFELLAAYGRSPSNITRLRNGSLNVANDPRTEVAQKNVLYFKPTSEDLYAVIDELRSSPAVVRYSTRFVIVTDYEDLLAVDTKTQETLATPIADIDKYAAFFLPWAGMEKAQYAAEAHADVKAAERMARLFDELVAINPEIHTTARGRHALNVFFTRLLFCFFAEDTGIFGKEQFTEAVGTLTQPDGSDVSEFLSDVFRALDTAESSRKPPHLAAFPYVNGRLFAAEKHDVVPVFNKQARDLLIESGRLLWNEINPDIFGSMFQAVVTPGERANLGQHYTSVPNILKTIEPLFLDELRERFDAGFDSVSRLDSLLKQIGQIKVFDPACGSGNFLVIAYKELRKLEHAVLERLSELRDNEHQGRMFGSQVNIEHFYGLELDDFAVEVAILSLWIAKHQMNLEFREKFGIDLPLISLKEFGQVRRGNAARVDWHDICPNDGSEAIYLIGNPPYAGAKVQSKDQKADYDFVFAGRPYSKNLDYIALWFVKGADYIAGTKAELAFVTTNSVAQGEHPSLLFPMLFQMGLEIGFAYTSFRWENNARRNAGVTVAVINLRSSRPGPKFLYVDDLRIEASHINGYLVDGDDVTIHRRRRPLSPALPIMRFGNMPLDGGSLILSPSERQTLIESERGANAFVRQLLGSDEFINGMERWCLWIHDQEVSEARAIPEIEERIRRTEEFRLASKDAGTRKKASVSHRFREQREAQDLAVLIPRHSSENREYIPIGLVGTDAVIADSALAVFDPELWVFALLTSRMHMVWTRAVAGRLETRIRYSKEIVYNNFPAADLSARAKSELSEAALRVLDVREYHSEMTPAELYDPDQMPDDLRLAHQELDELVDGVYRKRSFRGDEERLAHLFMLYERMTAEEESS